MRATFLSLAYAAIAFAQLDGGFITTVRLTKPELNSLSFAADGMMVYGDAHGVYRVRGAVQEQLLANEVGFCRTMFGSCGPIYHPRPAAVDPAGTVYVADPEQGTISRYDEDKKALVTLASGLGRPWDLTAAGDGSVYFNDRESCRTFRLRGSALTYITGTAVCGAKASGALTVTAAGDLYVADGVVGEVRRLRQDGRVETLLANQSILDAAGIAVDTFGTVYVSVRKNNQIVAIYPGSDGARLVAGTGTPGHARDGDQPVRAWLLGPTCLSSSQGRLWVCDGDRFRKIAVSPQGRWVVPVLAAESAQASPRSWRSVLGEFAGVADGDWSNAIGRDGSLPVSLGGVTAVIAGQQCVIGYVSRDRIDLLLPAFPQPLPQYPLLKLRWPGGSTEMGVQLEPHAPGFLTRFENGWLIPAAIGSDGAWITSEHPAEAGDTVRFYATGYSAESALSPAYDVNHPDGMQLIVGGTGYRVEQARSLMPGVVELTTRLPQDLRPGLINVRVFARFMSRFTTVLPVRVK